MPDGATKRPGLKDGTSVGFDLNTQRLHCLIALNDNLALKLSSKAGEAFFRAFIVEDRDTGVVRCTFRFRYTDEDSWFKFKLDKDKAALPLKEKIEYLADAVEGVLRLGSEIFTKGAAPPTEAVVRWYPPEPDDGQKTFDWLIAQDLISIRQVITPEGEVKNVTPGTKTPA